MARTRVIKGQVRTIDISIKEEASKNIRVGNFQLPLISRVLLLRLAVGDSFFLTRKPNTVLTKCISSFWAIRCYYLAHENVMLETIYKHLKVFLLFWLVTWYRLWLRFWLWASASTSGRPCPGWPWRPRSASPTGSSAWNRRRQPVVRSPEKRSFD